MKSSRKTNFVIRVSEVLVCYKIPCMHESMRAQPPMGCVLIIANFGIFITSCELMVRDGSMSPPTGMFVQARVAASC